MKIKKYLACLLLASLAGFARAELPSLKQVNEKWLLHVDGEPHLLLTGQVMNSSSFDPEWMETAWDHAKAMNLNTLVCPISWQAVEPVEGEFDFSMVDSLVKQARAHDMRLILLWFGTWKNARSFYVPPWVISDMDRFKRMEREDGQRIEVMSNLCQNTMAADRKAFTEFMKHLKRIDGRQNTVIMVQIQNEVGLLGDTRDRSDAADEAFASEVPQALMDYMVARKDRLKPHLKQVWALQGYPTSGTWLEVFGDGIEADEIFMAWHYAQYINSMAESGEAVYNLPMYVNGWLGQLKRGIPGTYPSGGPVARMMDIWKAGAPNIELMAADIYAFFKLRCKNFTREDNPLFVPEACGLWLKDQWSAPAKAFYTIAEAQGIGFGPFAIDHELYMPDHPIRVAYGALDNLSHLIVENIGTENMRGFYKEEGETETTVEMGPYRFNISYEPRLEQCYGLIIRIAEDEFIFAGNGLRIRFRPADLEKNSGISIAMVEEGEYDEKDRWVRQRIVGGDATIGTAGIKLPAHGYDLTHDKYNMSIQKVQLYPHPPRESGAVQTKDITPEF